MCWRRMLQDGACTKAAPDNDPDPSHSHDMKTQRHATILSLVQQARVRSQEELRELLLDKQIEVTQATLSRDLRELRLGKVTDPSGGSFYAPPADHASQFPPVEQLVPTLLLSIDGVGPLAVVRTPPGSAEALGGSLDHAAWSNVLGTIAGDDTLLIITRSEKARKEVTRRLGDLAGI